MDGAEACSYRRARGCAVLLGIFIHACGLFPGPMPILILLNSWIYASTLAYIVDANNGRSPTAVVGHTSTEILRLVLTASIRRLQIACSEDQLHSLPLKLQYLCRYDTAEMSK